MFLGVIIGALLSIILTPSLSNQGKYTDKQEVINFCKQKGGLVESREDVNGHLHKICVLPNKEVEIYNFYSSHPDNKKPQAIDQNTDNKICPTVCVPMWKIQNGSCIYDKCGSGCGPNNKTTFEIKEECLDNLN